MQMQLEGSLCSGLGEGARFTRLDWVTREFVCKLGFVPHPGTLNLSLTGDVWMQARTKLRQAVGIAIDPPGGFCAAKCFEVVINDCAKGAAILPDMPDYPADKFEIVSPIALRQKLLLKDGDRVSLRIEIK